MGALETLFPIWDKKHSFLQGQEMTGRPFSLHCRQILTNVTAFSNACLFSYWT